MGIIKSIRFIAIWIVSLLILTFTYGQSNVLYYNYHREL